MEKKSNKGIIVLVVLMFIIILGLVGYICYDKGVFDGLLGKDKPKPKQEEQVEEKLTEEEVKELLKTVPVSRWDGLDAYSASSFDDSVLTIDNVNHSLLLGHVLYTRVTPSKFDGKAATLEKAVKDFYNIDNVNHQDFFPYDYDSTNNKYTQKEGIGGPTATYDFMTELVNFNVENNILSIYEKVGFIVNDSFVDADSFGGYSLATVKLYYKDVNSTISKDDIVKEIGSLQDVQGGKAKTYFENNLNKFNTFKHTFKKANDGKYYWYSTEIFEKGNNTNSQTKENNETNNVSTPKNNFKLDSSDLFGGYGTVTVTGYSEVKYFSGHTMDNKHYYYVYFHILSGGNSAFHKVLKDLDQNSFAGKNKIGLGCKKDNKIVYVNDSAKYGRSKNFEISINDSRKILNSSKQNLITLELQRLTYFDAIGVGGGHCHSFITHVKVINS